MYFVSAVFGPTARLGISTAPTSTPQRSKYASGGVFFGAIRPISNHSLSYKYIQYQANEISGRYLKKVSCAEAHQP